MNLDRIKVIPEMLNTSPDGKTSFIRLSIKVDGVPCGEKVIMVNRSGLVEDVWNGDLLLSEV